MSVATQRSDSSVCKKSSVTPTVMMIGASSGVLNLRRKLVVFDEPQYNARIYFMPDVWLWRSVAKRSAFLFELCFGRQIRRFSEVVWREYPRNCKVTLLVHRDSVVDVVCAVANVLVKQGEIQKHEISILVLPTASGRQINVDEVRQIALRHGLPENIPVVKIER